MDPPLFTLFTPFPSMLLCLAMTALSVPCLRLYLYLHLCLYLCLHPLASPFPVPALPPASCYDQAPGQHLAVNLHTTLERLPRTHLPT